MKAIKNVYISGIGIHLQNYSTIEDLICGEETVNENYYMPENILGKKGLRYKDFATKIALCSAMKCLNDSGLLNNNIWDENRKDIGIIVSTNFGNIDTVAVCLDTIEKVHVNKTNALLLPNLSSNIIASSLAIKFKISGPNLTVCNGYTSGTDAVKIGINYINSGNVDMVLIVGSEPKNIYTSELLNNTEIEKEGEGAYSILIESEESLLKRNHFYYSKIEIGTTFWNKNLDEIYEYYSSQDFDIVADVQSKDKFQTSLENKVGWQKGSIGILQSAFSAFLSYISGKKIVAISGSLKFDISSLLINN